ncbi:hypothetical protein M4D55_23190 [Metabacillus idriensis]|nr:hypothetical protein [Metabacillus idriensis]MCM3598667.1 hypothetical protein [Metabacillus idriensis]
MGDLVFLLVASGMIFIALGIGFMLGSMGFIFDMIKKDKEFENLQKK